MTTKKKPNPPVKAKKTTGTITISSVAFKTVAYNKLKAHKIVKSQDRSVSWVVNQLIDKFLAGKVDIG